MIDHIIQHLELAEAYAANAARIATLKCRSRHSRDLIRRCREAADRERADAFAHAKSFGIDPWALRQERSTWQRLRQYSLDSTEALTLADFVWLKAVVNHGRPGSRNFRRAAELIHLAAASLGHGRVQNPLQFPSAELRGLSDGSGDGIHCDGGEPP